MKGRIGLISQLPVLLRDVQLYTITGSPHFYAIGSRIMCRRKPVTNAPVVRGSFGIGMWQTTI